MPPGCQLSQLILGLGFISLTYCHSYPLLKAFISTCCKYLLSVLTILGNLFPCSLCSCRSLQIVWMAPSSSVECETADRATHTRGLSPMMSENNSYFLTPSYLTHTIYPHRVLHTWRVEPFERNMFELPIERLMRHTSPLTVRDCRVALLGWKQNFMAEILIQIGQSVFLTLAILSQWFNCNMPRETLCWW